MTSSTPIEAWGDQSSNCSPARPCSKSSLPAFNKGTAVRQLMTYPPFTGRAPIFVGDDQHRRGCLQGDAGVQRPGDVGRPQASRHRQILRVPGRRAALAGTDVRRSWRSRHDRAPTGSSQPSVNFCARRTLCATRQADCRLLAGRTGHGARSGGVESRGSSEPGWRRAGRRPRGRAALVPQAQPGRLVRLERPHRGQGRGAGSRGRAFRRHLHHHRYFARRLPGILQRLRQPDAVADPALPARPRGVLQPRHGRLSARQRDVRRPLAGLPASPTT